MPEFAGLHGPSQHAARPAGARIENFFNFRRILSRFSNHRSELPF
jgi:hypothetical protein